VQYSKKSQCRDENMAANHQKESVQRSFECNTSEKCECSRSLTSCKAEEQAEAEAEADPWSEAGTLGPNAVFRTRE
jgi:hypothetical protein